MAAAKKAVSKKPAKAAAAPEVIEPIEGPAPVTEMEGEEYRSGFVGVSQDDADYTMAAEVARLSEEQ